MKMQNHYTTNNGLRAWEKKSNNHFLSDFQACMSKWKSCNVCDLNGTTYFFALEFPMWKWFKANLGDEMYRFRNAIIMEFPRENHPVFFSVHHMKHALENCFSLFSHLHGQGIRIIDKYPYTERHIAKGAYMRFSL